MIMLMAVTLLINIRERTMERCWLMSILRLMSSTPASLSGESQVVVACQIEDGQTQGLGRGARAGLAASPRFSQKALSSKRVQFLLQAVAHRAAVSARGNGTASRQGPPY